MVFAVTALVYAFTCLPNIGFWDSPEFIASNYKLQATHPPGAPLYTILARVIIALAPTTNVALVSNLISVLFGGLAMMVLFHITTFIAVRINPSKSDSKFGIEHVAGLVGSLSFAFCHSFWASATETEVYTLSFFLLNLTLWTALKWSASDSQNADRLLVLIGLLLGISIGVHMINLSVVIPLAVLYGFTRYKFSWKTAFLSTIAGVVAFVVLFGILFQGFLTFSSKLDMLAVNSFGLPVNTGIYSAYIGFLLLLLVGMFYYPNNRFKIRSVILPALFMFILGWSPYALLLIRANAETPTSHGVVSPNRLTEYIRAEQFGMGNVPLIKGPAFNAPLDPKKQYVDGPSIHVYDAENGKYIRTSNGKYTEPNYANEFDLLFPRIYHRSKLNVSWYNQWVAMKGQDVFLDVNGKTERFSKPTMLENLKFFFNYQVGWLNMRYLMWNFVGRQNDNKGTGLISNGNWITGIDLLDAPRVGSVTVMPERYRNNKSRDSYWLLPFLLGLVGAAYLFYRSKQYFLLSLLVFLTFGLGITIYVNPLPQSVLTRERDYIFMGASMVFAMCIGFSSIWLHQILRILKNQNARALSIGGLLLAVVPIQLLAKGWDDHYRANDTFPRQLAKAYLDACPQQAVLITSGDNMTFPLWYLQEVESYRTDVRIVNFDFLWFDWYVERLKKKINNSDPLNIQLPKSAYLQGAEKFRPLQVKTKQPAEVNEVLKYVSSPETTVQWNMRPTNTMPTDLFKISVDTSAIANGRIDLNGLQVKYVSEVIWRFNKDFYGHNDLLLLDIVANNLNERAICFAINGKSNHMIGLDNYMVHRGLVEQLLPLTPDSAKVNPKMVDVNGMLPYLMDSVDFHGLGNKYGFVDYENEIISRDVIRRNYYFLGQALLETGDTAKAIQIIEKAESVFPDSLIEYRQYAFSLGKLYHRAGELEKSKVVMSTCLENLEKELNWFVSVNPRYPIMNVRHVDDVIEMYVQMVNQFSTFHPALGEEKQDKLAQLETEYKSWRKLNWPY